MFAPIGIKVWKDTNLAK